MAGFAKLPVTQAGCQVTFVVLDIMATSSVSPAFLQVNNESGGRGNQWQPLVSAYHKLEPNN